MTAPINSQRQQLNVKDLQSEGISTAKIDTVAKIFKQQKEYYECVTMLEYIWIRRKANLCRKHLVTIKTMTDFAD